jgi:hypothetical protein
MTIYLPAQLAQGVIRGAPHGLLRPNLITWDEPDYRLHGRRKRNTFALSEAGIRGLDARIPNG